MEKIRLNELSMAFERRGSGAPLLLVHGFPLDHDTWHALAALLEADFDVIMPDLRGFGDSEAPYGAASMAQMAGDLTALLDALKIQKTYIAGHSMGGYVCLAFAAAYPARVLGLGLLGSQAAADDEPHRAGRFTTAQKVELDGPTAVLGMAEKLSANPDHVPYFRQVIQRQHSAGLAAALRAMAGRPDCGLALAGFTFPVALVHGLADALIPPERSREMKALLPHARLTELPGVGHSAALEAPLETAQALRALAD